MIRSTVWIYVIAAYAVAALGQDFSNDKFRQLEELLPSPNETRTASGAPGHDYWQQEVDYKIHVTLDDEKQRLLGSEEIRYKNNSPDTLRYLWVQLDANKLTPDSDHVLSQSATSLQHQLRAT